VKELINSYLSLWKRAEVTGTLLWNYTVQTSQQSQQTPADCKCMHEWKIRRINWEEWENERNKEFGLKPESLTTQPNHDALYIGQTIWQGRRQPWLAWCYQPINSTNHPSSVNPWQWTDGDPFSCHTGRCKDPWIVVHVGGWPLVVHGEPLWCQAWVNVRM